MRNKYIIPKLSIEYIETLTSMLISNFLYIKFCFKNIKLLKL